MNKDHDKETVEIVEGVQFDVWRKFEFDGAISLQELDDYMKKTISQPPLPKKKTYTFTTLANEVTKINMMNEEGWLTRTKPETQERRKREDGALEYIRINKNSEQK